MAKKITTRRKRTLRIEAIAPLFFVISLFLFFLCQVFVKNLQVSMTIQQQQIQAKMVDLQKENMTVQVQIQQLQRADRMSAALNGEGLSTSTTTVTAIDPSGDQ